MCYLRTLCLSWTLICFAYSFFFIETHLLYVFVVSVMDDDVMLLLGSYYDPNNFIPKLMKIGDDEIRYLEEAIAENVVIKDDYQKFAEYDLQIKPGHYAQIKIDSVGENGKLKRNLLVSVNMLSSVKKAAQ